MERDPLEKEWAALFSSELDFAYFAARLGWSKADWEQTTHVERLLIRKELESVTVSNSNLAVNATQIAIANCFDKRKRKRRLWTKKGKKAAPVISKREMAAIKRTIAQRPPWTPWQGKGVRRG